MGTRARLTGRAATGLLAGLVAAQLRHPFLPERRRVASTRRIVGLCLAASAAETVAAKGPRRAAALLGSAAAVGFGAELTGVATGRPFGHYMYSDRLGVRICGVPVLAAAAWTMMARPAWVAAGWWTRRRAARAAVAAAGLAAWDVFLDPRMVREGYWNWPGGGRYAGVPASNFAGWLCVGGALFAVWALLDGDDDPAVGDGALALYAWTWTGETVAAFAIWRTPLVGAAGAAAMGAVAAPALARRARA